MMRTKGIALDPTLWPREMLPIPRSMANLPNLESIAAGWVSQERAKLDRARKAGVKIVFGSDMWFGYPQRTRGQATRLVLESLQTSFGMTAADGLRAATVGAAELLNSPGVTGTIEAKAFADLIAVDGDPLTTLTDLEKIVFVMKGGAVIRDDARARPAPQS
jgi:imidazolonepropionase-like amidohydrolase